MKGLTDTTAAVLVKLKNYDLLNDWVLCGGTALAMQLGHRLSEDLDFMQWEKNAYDKMEVPWRQIKDYLESEFDSVSMDLLDINHVEYIANNVKLSFYARQSRAPQLHPIRYSDNICLADINAIAAMKIEVLMRRGKFRDIYDIYSIINTEGYSDIMRHIDNACDYSGHALKHKMAIALLTNSKYYSIDSSFDTLQPIYHITPQEMAQAMSSCIIDCNKKSPTLLTLEKQVKDSSKENHLPQRAISYKTNKE